ncbi:hypothetical protein CHS0354_033801 [Potamilus streckersoni]|uniref:Thioredoxin-like protein 1 n=1 Tax=Potamilus streckersoni TaxID=2493646 RepID=A0AAE0SG63_9BIVA|nr:hypothetical protein CHS0354_033801 [Potamilus streckersoni]
MAVNLKMIKSDAEWDAEMTAAGTQLVVVDFYASWCGPCQKIAPKFAEFVIRYSEVIYFKVDVDECQELAQREGVSAMPTFNFYKNKVKIDSQRGADEKVLEDKIKRWMGYDDEDNEVTVKGHMDLSRLINKFQCECLNESDDHPLSQCLTTKGGYLQSDCDEQLIINITFNQSVKLHSLKLYAPEDKGPKTVKIFQNHPSSLDFDSADCMEPTQTLELTPDDLKEGNLIPLKFVKFQNVNNVTLFIKDNQAGEEVTQVDYLGFVGSIQNATNMSEFKRVSGKKGESH